MSQQQGQPDQGRRDRIQNGFGGVCHCRLIYRMQNKYPDSPADGVIRSVIFIAPRFSS